MDRSTMAKSSSIYFSGDLVVICVVQIVTRVFPQIVVTGNRLFSFNDIHSASLF